MMPVCLFSGFSLSTFPNILFCFNPSSDVCGHKTLRSFFLFVLDLADAITIHMSGIKYASKMAGCVIEA